MNPCAAENQIKGRKRLLLAVGVLSLCIGAFAAFATLLELKSFAQFAPGGRFGYDGFGPGSFMFGIITLQAIGYAAIAAVFIMVGFAHVFLRPWTAKLSRALLYTWTAVGPPVALLCFFLAAAAKNLTITVLVLIAVFLGFACFLFPALMLRFYLNGRTVAALRTDIRPFSLSESALTLILLSAFNILMSASIRLFGCFPAFGALLTGWPGTAAFAAVSLCFLALIPGLLRSRRWALWGFVTLSLLLCASAAITFCLHSYPEMLSALAYPAEEMAYLQNIPLRGFHIAIFLGYPLLAGTALASILSKRFSVV